jgi:hypothetical protein
VGALVVVTTEVPSATINVHVAAGSYLKQDGTIGTYPGSLSQAMTAPTTNYRRFSRTLNLPNPHPVFSADRPVFSGFFSN